MQAAQRFDVRVYYEDTDAAGIVYYANYLRFAERARTEVLRAGGIDQSHMLENTGVGFVVRKCSADFLKPAKLDDLLTIHTRLADIGRVSVLMHQAICRGDETLVKLDVKLGVVDRELTITAIPPQVKDVLHKLFNR